VTALESLFAELARAVAREVVAELRAGETPGMLDQAGSPLGRRRHIAAVRRRVAAGETGAAVVGRRHLLSREALDAELATLARKPRKPSKKSEPAADELAEMRAKYGLVRKIA
jgi:hypothetical protein